MKRTFSLWLGLLALACVPMVAQAPTGKIHGHVINPTGSPQGTGTVSLSPSLGAPAKATFKVDPNGEYSGEAPVGTYILIFRQLDTPPDKEVDHIENVKIVAGQTTEQDDDMSRQAYIDKLPEDQKKQLEEIRKHNSEAMKANEVIKHLNTDLRAVGQDIKDADGARAAAIQELGAGATRAAVDAKEAEIRTAKYTDAESLMQKDTAARPDAAILWARLGQAELGLKKYDDAITSFKKTLEVDSASKKPSPDVQGLAQSGLGEAYARAGKIQEANAAYDEAAKAYPAQAGFYYKNEAVIFFQMGNGDAQVAAADKALAVNPNDALLYYLKGQGLVAKATVDPKTNRIVLPDGCADAYQKYLELAPTGPYSEDAKGILQQAGQKVNSSYKAGKK